MPLQNADISMIFNQVADLLELQGANPFRSRAYRNAARVISNWPGSIATALQRPDEELKIPGIGADLRGKILEVVRTGNLRMLQELKSEVPPGLPDLLRIPSLGPKRVRSLLLKLGVRSLKDLKKAATLHKIRDLEGFGAKTEERILAEVKRLAATPTRYPWLTVHERVDELVGFLKGVPGVREAIAAGSYRRRQETVGDIDILAIADKRSPVMERFTSHEDVLEVLSSGPTRSTVILRSGIQVDLRVVPMESFGAALHYFTGSKAHNIAVRSIGVKRGLKINEYGVFRANRRIAGRTEEEVFRSVKLPYIEPELREDRGEIEAAKEGGLPRLIELSDLRGDLHAHSSATDGRMTIEEMAEAARKLGHEYLAITDHSQRLTVARGLTPKRLLQQLEEIDRINDRLKGFRILKAIELDILEDGRLDLPDRVLDELDLSVCSVHSYFELGEERQTARILKAMDNPRFKIFAHPSGRLLGSRPPIRVDFQRLMEGARERGCFFEVNSQPERMDFTDVHCKMAKEMGVKLVVSSDAHSAHQLAFLRNGVFQARRGWLEPADVLNTRPWRELKRFLRRK